MRMMRQLAIGLFAAVTALGATGCESKPRMGEYMVTVALADGFTPAGSIEVDLVGVAEGRDKEAIEGVTAAEYFRAMSDFRDSQDRRIALVFRPGGETSQTIDLTRRGPYHTEWKNAGVMHLVALARLERPAGSDLWRYVLPLDKRRWNTKNLKIVIDASKLSPNPAPLPIEQ